MSEKLCIFCVHFMGSTMTGPMFTGGDAICSAGRFKGQWDNRPNDESEYRTIILRGQNCPDYSEVQP